MPPPPPPTLYLIDGYAQFFRAYHAIRVPMTSPVTKEPTNLTFGFLGMLLKLLRAEGKVGEGGGRPDYLALALDVGGDRGTFRSELYTEYKANRPPAPDDLAVQVDRCLRTLETIGVPILGSPGFEADDVLATLVTKLRESHPELRIRIISKDKDLKQLLCDGEEGGGGAGVVELYDIHTDQSITCTTLSDEGGLKPSQVIDMLALMGDTVDNVPGVEGVGPKTAAQLIAQYGSLENLISHAAEIKGKRGENIRAAAAGGDKSKLALSRRLVTLRHDVPIELDLAAADTASLALEALLPILRELGFNRYQDEVKALLGVPAGASPEGAARSTGPATGAAATAAKPPKRPTAAAKADPFDGGLFGGPGTDAATTTDAAPAIIKAQSGVYRCIRTLPELHALIAEARAAPIFAIDTETTSLSPHRARLCGVSLSTAPGTGAYIPTLSPSPGEHLNERTVLDALRPLLEDPHQPKCGHNLKYDLLIFRKHGIKLAGYILPLPEGGGRGEGSRLAVNAASTTDSPLPIADSLLPSPVFDSMVASYLIDASRSSHSLDSLSLALLGRTNISIKDLLGSGPGGTILRTFDTVPLDAATEYAAEDADAALQLHQIMLPQLTDMGLLPLFTGVEMPLVEVLAELEWNGITVDPDELDRQRARLQVRIDELRAKLIEEVRRTLGREFNPDSPRQLAAVLFNKPAEGEALGGPGLGLKADKKLKTGYSTDIMVLEKLAADPAVTTPIPGLIVEHRHLSRLVNTYLVALKEAIEPSTGRVHSCFSQAVAATGRLSSSDPNLQNIPIRTEIGREIRKAFTAARGKDPAKHCVLVSADYSQIELRLLAHLSRDPALIEAFRSGLDVHTAVAAQINNIVPEEVTKAQRNNAKMVNFGIVYGVTAFGLARRLGKGVTTSQAEEIIRGYKKRFAGITTFLQECIEQARRFGYVETMLKRRRPIPDIDSNNPGRRSFAERIAINSVVQGSAADLIKLAMIDIHARLKTRTDPPKMLLQIHDELVFECPKEEAEPARILIVERMESAMTLSVPLKVDSSIAETWYDGK